MQLKNIKVTLNFCDDKCCAALTIVDPDKKELTPIILHNVLLDLADKIRVQTDSSKAVKTQWVLNDQIH